MEKENNTDENDFSENEIPDLYSLKPFEFVPKTNIGDQKSKVRIRSSHEKQSEAAIRGVM